ncbi:hypothetical protein LWC34_51730 [Kibdelosporangium philippinense]|uniref:MBL fold metallo-hydrolase n=1 Tax=Kibdelosporangium philippinense TaxID=211113 RepID=A0ABS8ZU48_9PSEU|nr:hypothetical protein [Kibdelosporangium philippinense]MCE7011226.1 hypothetical protein [Kibdelosporangium philippinense]
MRHRDLTIRVFGPFPNTRYVVLAHGVGSYLVVAGLADQAVLVTDDMITASEVEVTAGLAGHAPCLCCGCGTT